MIRLLRIAGFALVAAGALMLLSWASGPLRWLLPWWRRLPPFVQWGLGLAAAGLLLLGVTLLVERLSDLRREKDLSKD